MSNPRPTHPAVPDRPRVVFLGMPCAFSAPPLAALVAAGMHVAAVVLPAPPGGPALRWHRPARPRSTGPAMARAPGPGDAPSLLAVAAEAGLPLLFAASVRSGPAVEEIARLRPDAIAVACYPERLPAALLRLPPLGALNVHPSLLPRDRGPSPLFWAFHRGAVETGVTVHLMEGRLDAGPIVRQRAVPIREGARLVDLEQTLATIGGGLLVDAIAARAGGERSVTPQDESLATSASFPSPADSVVDQETWDARRAFAFVRGVRSATVRLQSGALVPVVDARRWGPSMTPGTSVSAEREGLLVGFGEGWVELQVSPGERTG